MLGWVRVLAFALFLVSYLSSFLLPPPPWDCALANDYSTTNSSNSSYLSPSYSSQHCFYFNNHSELIYSTSLLPPFMPHLYNPPSYSNGHLPPLHTLFLHYPSIRLHHPPFAIPLNAVLVNLFILAPVRFYVMLLGTAAFLPLYVPLLLPSFSSMQCTKLKTKLESAGCITAFSTWYYQRLRQLWRLMCRIVCRWCWPPLLQMTPERGGVRGQDGGILRVMRDVSWFSVSLFLHLFCVLFVVSVDHLIYLQRSNATHKSYTFQSCACGSPHSPLPITLSCIPNSTLTPAPGAHKSKMHTPWHTSFIVMLELHMRPDPLASFHLNRSLLIPYIDCAFIYRF